MKSKLEIIYVCCACREVHKTHTKCVGCDAGVACVRPFLDVGILLSELDSRIEKSDSSPRWYGHLSVSRELQSLRDLIGGSDE